MGDYFKPWRRKFGVLTLVIACALMAGWVRSQSILDLVFIRNSLIIVSGDSGITIANHVRLNFSAPGILNAGSVDYDPSSNKELFIDVMSTRRYRMTDLEFKSFAVPYWAIVVPLTLPSAWMLLSKPRSPVAKKSVATIPESVT